jgi:hypothetical protein
LIFGGEILIIIVHYVYPSAEAKEKTEITSTAPFLLKAKASRAGALMGDSTGLSLRYLNNHLSYSPLLHLVKPRSIA